MMIFKGRNMLHFVRANIACIVEDSCIQLNCSFCIAQPLNLLYDTRLKKEALNYSYFHDTQVLNTN